MKNNTKYSIIIPTYNERENIGTLIFMIDKYLSPEYDFIKTRKIDYEIIIVDDNSPDKTQEVIKYGEINRLLRKCRGFMAMTR
jgi:dolichol-phosphate mannosyltransferase